MTPVNNILLKQIPSVLILLYLNMILESHRLKNARKVRGNKLLQIICGVIMISEMVTLLSSWVICDIIVMNKSVIILSYAKVNKFI